MKNRLEGCLSEVETFEVRFLFFSCAFFSFSLFARPFGKELLVAFATDNAMSSERVCS